MSFTVSTSPSEDAQTIRNLLQANLLAVFNERDATARLAAIKTTYTDDIVWYEDDRVNVGHAVLDARAAELLAESPEFVFQPDGSEVVARNLGVLNWQFGPTGTPDLIKGTDVILVEGGKVKALWTAVTKVPGP